MFNKHRLAEDTIEPSQPVRSIRVLIAEDSAAVRHGIRSMLDAAAGVEVAGEAADGVETLRVAAEVKPDTILMDQDMPRCDGIEATRRLKRSMPEVEIVIISDRLDEAKALQAMEAGAMGYVLKDIPAPYLAAAVRSVCNRRAFFHPEITRAFVDRLRRLIQEHHAETKREPEELTPRQFDILVEMAKGSTYSEIANRFVVTEGTVKTHIHNILRRLDCHNRTQLVAYALRKGLIK